ncbi:MAG TPA: lysoplasmalogenase family protein [Sphingomonadaceae bacterium]|nr:lysoplasmalogenase family protein [Sphingomonadaceae bacterium]
MSRHALLEKRPYLLLSIAAAVAYYILREGYFPELYLAFVKGAACALLATYAVLRHKGRDALMIAAVMAIAAIADMVIEFYPREGGLVFFASHVVALTLYLQPHNRRDHLTPSQKGAAVALLLLTPLAAWLLSRDWGVAIYALALGGMAGAAWTSRFSRYHVGIGVLLFVASDMLIFARMGGAGIQSAIGNLPHLLIWPLYYIGQFLICTGVIQTLRRDHHA